MKPIEIEFEKLEFGTLFFDPITGGQYRKVAEDKAVVENDEVYQSRIAGHYRTEDSFDPDEVVIV